MSDALSAQPAGTARTADGRPGTVLLDVRGLRVAYGKAEVVRDVSFDVRAGEFGRASCRERV